MLALRAASVTSPPLPKRQNVARFSHAGMIDRIVTTRAAKDARERWTGEVIRAWHSCLAFVLGIRAFWHRRFFDPLQYAEYDVVQVSISNYHRLPCAIVGAATEGRLRVKTVRNGKHCACALTRQTFDPPTRRWLGRAERGVDARQKSGLPRVYGLFAGNWHRDLSYD